MTGIGVPLLERFWAEARAHRTEGRRGAFDPRTFMRYDVMLRGLHLDLHETLAYLYAARPDLAAFERWIVEQNAGAVDAERIARLNAALRGEAVGEAEISGEPVFTADDIAFWSEHGYVVLHDAISRAACAAVEDAIWAHLAMDRNDPSTWYGGAHGHSIWVPLRRDPALWAARRAPRVHRAFAQLWGRTDLWTTIDQVGFNPPEHARWRFPGPDLHWDVSLAPPVPFGLQALLYIVDVAPDQGAFTCVPGFHRRIDDWVGALPPGSDPRTQDLHALGARPVAGRAGDLIIWHHALPHGASANRARRPRIVQYLKMQPVTWEQREVWR